MSKYESGELLYFVSGFLSLQLELQNFLYLSGYGGTHIRTHNFRDKKSVPNPVRLLEDLLLKSVPFADTPAALARILNNRTSAAVGLGTPPESLVMARMLYLG